MTVLVLLAVPSLAVAAQTWDAASGPNLVTNPSFEEVREGRIVGWDGAAAVYGSDATTAASGVRSPRFVNHEPNSYVLCTQAITLQPGFMYEVKALVRTQGLNGQHVAVRTRIIAAVIRKLLHLTFGLPKSGRPFDPNYQPQGI